MAKGLTKAESRTWLELMREFMDSKLPLPLEALRHIDQLEVLRVYLKRDMKRLAEKLYKALHPVQGQRINPENSWQDVQKSLWEVLAYLDFCGSTVFHQRFEIERLRQNSKGSPAASIPHKPAARAKNTPKRKTRAS